MLQNELPPVPGSTHKKKRLGRGNSSGHGTYSGRGIKGQKSRSGPDLRIGFEGGQIQLIRALSRLRGFNNRFRTEYEVINVSDLAALGAGANVTTATLREAGLVKTNLPVKILGDGDIDVAITVEADRFSASATAKIEKAGGKVTDLSIPLREAAAEEKSKGKKARRAAEAAKAPVAAAPSEEPAAEAEAEPPAARRGRAAKAEETEDESSESEAET